jgi:hypothetical protein
LVELVRTTFNLEIRLELVLYLIIRSKGKLLLEFFILRFTARL